MKVNALEIGKQVYETGKHIDTKSVRVMNAESKYHLSYMASVLKLDKEECYKRWLELDDKIITPLTRDEFENYYKKALKFKFSDDVQQFQIHQSDIDYINSLDIKLATKEIALVILAYCYSCDQWEFKTVYGDTIPSLATKMNHVLTADFHKSYSVKAYELKQAGMIKIIPGKKRWNKKEGLYEDGHDTNMIIKPESYGDILLESNLLFDVTELFWMFRAKKCSCCGNEFEMSNKCQTDLCEECYKKKIKKNDVNRKRDIRSFIGDKIRICEDCGKEFECTGKCQRTKCEECYKIYRKLIIANAVKNYKEQHKNR